MLETDGVAVSELYCQRVDSTDCVTLDYVANSTMSSSLDGSAGSTLYAHTGYYAATRPFAAGSTHTLHFMGGYQFTTDVQGFDGGFTLDITYHITVGDAPTWATPPTP